MSQPMAPSSMRFFTCISGPDQGKRFEIREGEVLIGRSRSATITTGITGCSAARCLSLVRWSACPHDVIKSMRLDCTD
jgi:hypothetical protein